MSDTQAEILKSALEALAEGSSVLKFTENLREDGWRFREGSSTVLIRKPERYLSARHLITKKTWMSEALSRGMTPDQAADAWRKCLVSSEDPEKELEMSLDEFYAKYGLTQKKDTT